MLFPYLFFAVSPFIVWHMYSDWPMPLLMWRHFNGGPRP